ncbi:uncharacterized protein LJ206_014903 isoform 1-T5 [Theristicus caerulescens]
MDEMDWDLWNGIILLSTKLSWRWKKEKITAFSHSTGTEDGMDCRLGFHNLGRWSCDLALIWDQWDRGQQVCLDHTVIQKCKWHENGIIHQMEGVIAPTQKMELQVEDAATWKVCLCAAHRRITLGVRTTKAAPCWDLQGAPPCCSVSWVPPDLTSVFTQVWLSLAR